MQLSRLYANRQEFQAIDFHEDLSVIYAEIRLPMNADIDTHNLGKSTVGEVIDFCLLKGKSKSFFLFSNFSIFREFTFYLELKLGSGRYLTIARPVDPGSKLSFIRTSESMSLKTLPATEDWDHVEVPFQRAKTLLDGILELRVLQPWGLRNVAGYLVRSQNDYRSVFQLGKFSGKHREWKPFVAHLLGMDSDAANQLYRKRDELDQANQRLEILSREWGSAETDSSILDGLIAVKRQDVDSLAQTLDSFNFEEQDRRVTGEVVESVEAELSRLNEEKYHLSQLVQQLQDSLQQDSILFDPDSSERLFREAGVMFANQLKRDFTQLIEFNRAITQERRAALRYQLAECERRLEEIDPEISRLNARRADALEFLRESEALAKYRELGRQMTQQRSELEVLELKRESVARISELRREQRRLSEEFGHAQTTAEQKIVEISRNESSRFANMRRYFNEIVFEVLGQKAVLAINTNSEGGLEFTAEFVGPNGSATKDDHGTTYKKLLCIAFDLAMLRAYLDVPFPRFVYHDGALEQLEPRKQRRLLAVMRKYSEYGLQPLISVLSKDLPDSLDSAHEAVSSREIVLTLHDEGEEGRLFRMPPW